MDFLATNIKDFFGSEALRSVGYPMPKKDPSLDVQM
jgi:hypothetical protein